MGQVTSCSHCDGWICVSCGNHAPCGKCDALNAPIPKDLKCYGACSKYSTPHTHVRGNWNRPGYAREACEASGSASCFGHYDIHHTDHFHLLPIPQEE